MCAFLLGEYTTLDSGKGTPDYSENDATIIDQRPSSPHSNSYGLVNRNLMQARYKGCTISGGCIEREVVY